MSSASSSDQRKHFDTHQRRLDAVMLGCVAASPLALGGTHPTAAAVLFVLFSAMSVAAYGIHVRYRRSWRQFVPIWVLAALCAWVLVRATPLGAWTNAPIAQDAWSLWPELTVRGGIAPGRAALWVARTLTLVATASYAALRFSRTDRVARAALALIAAGCVVAITGALQSVLGASHILGLYAPLDWARVVPLAGPFVNPNQAGALVGLAAVVALCGARFADKPQHRIALGILCVPLTAYVALLDARGALIAVLAAALSFFAGRLVEDLSPTIRATILCVWTGLLASCAMLALYVLLPFRAGAGAESTLLAKMQVWNASLQVPLHAPVFGFGPRGFQDAFSSLGLNTSHVWIEDPESGPLQFAAEHGLVVSALLLIGAGVVFFRATRNSPRSGWALSSGLNAVTIYIVLESITGMGLHASAYLAMVGVVLGILIGRAAREQARPAWDRRLAAQPLALLGLALVCMAALPASVQTSLADSRAPLIDALRTERLSSPVIDASLRRASRRTPGSPALILQAALLADARGDHARAMELARGARRHAPNSEQVSAATVRLAFKNRALDDACTWLDEHETRFQSVPVDAIDALIASGLPLQDCLKSDAALLNAFAALQRSTHSDVGFALILQLANQPEPSRAVRLAATDASVRAKIPALATLWVQALIDDPVPLSEDDYATLTRWAAAMPPSDPYQLELLAAAAADHPDNASFRIRYIEAYMAGVPEDAPPGWYDELLPVIDAARSLARGDRELSRRAQWIHADAAWRATRVDEAEAIYDRLPLQGLTARQQALMHFRRGEYARANNDYYRAKRHYEQALELQPRFPEARRALDEIGG